jgi:hypothetical protein
MRDSDHADPSTCICEISDIESNRVTNLIIESQMFNKFIQREFTNIL